jgi:Protein of unknown function (DUF3243)
MAVGTVKYILSKSRQTILETKMKEVKHMSVLDNFEQWKDFLANRLEQAQQQGLSQQVISDIAYQIGDYLAKQVDPKNPEERLLADLWKVADEQEQHAIANMMVKLVQQQ